MPFKIIRNNITELEVDAIVNAANTDLRMGGGVCGAIFNAAGAEQLQEACNKLGSIKTGEAVITPGFNLNAKYVIHTACPIYHNGKQNEEELLMASYRNSLQLAMETNCESIAFPLISSGIYGYPKVEALEVAQDTIKKFLSENDLDVYLVVFDKEAFSFSQELFQDVEDYISDNLTDEAAMQLAMQEERVFLYARKGAEHKLRGTREIALEATLKDTIASLDEPFSTILIRLIQAKNMEEVDVYKKANIDRKLFSKIRSGKGYVPSKPTILALCIALELSLEEVEVLLKSAGYALSHSHKFDVIIEYFIVNEEYDIYKINEMLFYYDQAILGG